MKHLFIDKCSIVYLLLLLSTFTINLFWNGKQVKAFFMNSYSIRHSLAPSSSSSSSSSVSSVIRNQQHIARGKIQSTCLDLQSPKNSNSDDTDEQDGRAGETQQQQRQLEAHLKILAARRQLIRSVLKSAESARNYQLQQEDDEEGENNANATETNLSSKKRNKDTKFAISLTAFLVAAGAIILRVGGRAALVSTLGLDFAQDNPELKDTLDSCLAYTESMDSSTKLILFFIAWTFVKVFCFDFGGIVLAFISGIVFGGVVQGATLSALAATLGSTVAFYLAQAPTPFRNKALQLLDENPSLRGIQKVVSQDGFKTILTLRLAPVLPIPLGMYNYIYGLTNVTIPNFAGGVFLGSLKPYFLDSYLGYFGMQLVEGDDFNKVMTSSASSSLLSPGTVPNPSSILDAPTLMDTTTISSITPTATTTSSITNDLFQISQTDMQDFILLFALGASVLIGTFASQLAGDTWESIQKEIQIDKDAKKQAAIRERGFNNTSTYDEDAIIRKFLGFPFPDWVIGMQIAYQEANQRINTMIQTEYSAKVWNYTSDSIIPSTLDPAQYLDSPEKSTNLQQGFNFVPSFMDGLALSPCLIQAFFKYSDPQYNQTIDPDLMPTLNFDDTNVQRNILHSKFIDVPEDSPIVTNYTSKQELIENWTNILSRLRHTVEAKLDALNENATKQYQTQK